VQVDRFARLVRSKTEPEQESIVIERFAGFSPEPVGGFAKQRQGFGSNHWRSVSANLARRGSRAGVPSFQSTKH